MSKWIRPLGNSGQWHSPASDRDFVAAKALCGVSLSGALEATSDDEKAAREGQCTGCAETLASKRESASAGRAH